MCGVSTCRGACRLHLCLVWQTVDGSTNGLHLFVPHSHGLSRPVRGGGPCKIFVLSPRAPLTHRLHLCLLIGCGWFTNRLHLLVTLVVMEVETISWIDIFYDEEGEPQRMSVRIGGRATFCHGLCVLSGGLALLPVLGGRLSQAPFLGAHSRIMCEGSLTAV